jgi:hypothetical protein
MYAQLARAYADACANGRKPIKALARKWKLAEHVIRNRVARARDRELLTGAKAGKQGGFLTERAKAVLAGSK